MQPTPSVSIVLEISEEVRREGEGLSFIILGRFRCRDGFVLRVRWGLSARGTVGVDFPLLWSRSLSCCCISFTFDVLPSCVGRCFFSLNMFGPGAVGLLASTILEFSFALGARVLVPSSRVLLGDDVLSCVGLLLVPGVLGPSSCVGFPNHAAPGAGLLFSDLLCFGGLPVGGCVGSGSWFTCVVPVFSASMAEWE